MNAMPDPKPIQDQYQSGVDAGRGSGATRLGNRKLNSQYGSLLKGAGLNRGIGEVSNHGPES